VAVSNNATIATIDALRLEQNRARPFLNGEFVPIIIAPRSTTPDT
jgi:hypothetical protein